MNPVIPQGCILLPFPISLISSFYSFQLFPSSLATLATTSVAEVPHFLKYAAQMTGTFQPYDRQLSITIEEVPTPRQANRKRGHQIRRKRTGFCYAKHSSSTSLIVPCNCLSSGLKVTGIWPSLFYFCIASACHAMGIFSNLRSFQLFPAVRSACHGITTF